MSTAAPTAQLPLEPLSTIAAAGASSQARQAQRKLRPFDSMLALFRVDVWPTVADRERLAAVRQAPDQRDDWHELELYFDIGK